MNLALPLSAAISDPLALALSYYFGAGLLFALVFVFFLARVIDVHAKGSSFGFKLMILPASTILWPVVFLVTGGKLILRWRDYANERKQQQLAAKRAEARAAKQEAKKAAKAEQEAAAMTAPAKAKSKTKAAAKTTRAAKTAKSSAAAKKTPARAPKKQ